MDTRFLAGLRDFYRKELTDNILPFWLRYARDRKCGGYHTCLNRDGAVYDYDKLCMWHAGRMIWTYSFLYNELVHDPEWLDMARWGVDFVQKHGFAPDGTMYYALTREGQPLQPAQDVYTELSTVMGFSEFARATSYESLYEQARDIFLRVWDMMMKEPGRAFQPFDFTTRPVRMHGHSMITLGVLQELRRYRADPVCEAMIDQCLDAIINLHMKAEKRALFEMVGWNGEQIPGTRGRWINPGHMIECGTFIIHEGRRRGNDKLVGTGVNLTEWGFEWGWDKEFGGIFNDVDCDGLPEGTALALVYDSKLWWQHAEALYGLLLAYVTTEQEKFLDAYKKVHDYSFEKFADPEYGEWFALLDRRGNLINTAKGTSRKGAFHIARNFYLCHKLLTEVTQDA